MEYLLIHNANENNTKIACVKDLSYLKHYLPTLKTECLNILLSFAMIFDIFDKLFP